MIGLLPSLIFLGGYGWRGGGGLVVAKRAKEGGHKNLLQTNCQGRGDHKNVI